MKFDWSKSPKRLACGIAAIAAGLLIGVQLLADGPATSAPATQPSAPATRPVVAATQSSVLSKKPIKAALRPIRPALAGMPDALPPSEKLAIPSISKILPPAPHQLKLGPRYVPQPAPPIAARIPNLLSSPRKAQIAANPPLGAPANPLTTPPVNNLEGTSALNLIPPFTREISIDVAPPPSVMPFEQEPYQQAPTAPDELDAPVPTTQPATRPTMK